MVVEKLSEQLSVMLSDFIESLFHRLDVPEDGFFRVIMGVPSGRILSLKSLCKGRYLQKYDCHFVANALTLVSVVSDRDLTLEDRTMF